MGMVLTLHTIRDENVDRCRGDESVELPDDIEQQILEYLHLEYGESPEDEDAMKLSELRYEGIHEMEGVPMH